MPERRTSAAPLVCFYLVQKTGTELKPGTEPGVYHVTLGENDEGEPLEHWNWICSPELENLGLARDERQTNWSVGLRWRDLDGNEHQEFIPAEWLEGSGLRVRQWLASRGLRITPYKPRSNDRLITYIQSERPKDRFRCVSRVGWYKNLYVLSGGEVFGHSKEQVIFRSPGDVHNRDLHKGTAGSLADWQANLARLCEGNTLLQQALCTSFTGPVLRMVGQSSFGRNYVGPTSTGKTTLGEVAASVWGGDGERPNVETWRATLNGLESIAAAHRDGFAVLDEMHDVEPKAAAHGVYMFSEERGKTRLDRDSNPMPTREMVIDLHQHR